MSIDLANIRFACVAADLQLRHRTRGSQMLEIVPDVDNRTLPGPSWALRGQSGWICHWS